MVRHDGRKYDEMRKVEIKRRFLKNPSGSVLISLGETKVLCTATVEEKVPQFLENTGTGWITAEYSLLPGSTHTRTRREASAGKISGRTHEIQRLIGRSLRSIADLSLLGERTIWIDCDVLQADGGTRTASITGAYVALADAIETLLLKKAISRNPIKDQVAGISVGIVKGKKCLDLNYKEDSNADVDMNVIMTRSGKLVEVQATAEKNAFSKNDLDDLLSLARKGIFNLFDAQKKALSK
ncbi:MAG: ribonuclease PH [Candidatus Schekmanbacteria bacterium RIFCSPHIGHO2_02_FULL_38_11]|uniref:Ribonuclease PH n=1 Tax=Candidatus Schekmanbacteria bacterium RIFCSPLOWO2_12_FULL_38_15 TaxID=1817883 RepID=A0A1F7SJE4_9BACT|nr:MAG: ribonuclease PH [Candidatus Schekmanbacteria bacterium GWA2_38_9]OGL48080.1 MAG: ribonuclease PH [Candidatus Schekmanbacteria bacterium RIFCSPHIGHO2_02_FULL_38_11]OGL50441.1 MAG: ribonuclease PH [Candidatus Schekmanbacteria bacterium RIFCSPLOWO2_02_FULL_38_14]OGL53900.1 MAG: ribonuclease PH [Candidatus Schekmanbacteria bacterium RIFCSPLOWO2_12_FULL_38_15]